MYGQTVGAEVCCGNSRKIPVNSAIFVHSSESFLVEHQNEISQSMFFSSLGGIRTNQLFFLFFFCSFCFSNVVCSFV